MITAVGHSNNPITSQAVEEILLQTRESLQGRRPGLGILFTSRMDADFKTILDQIMQSWPDLQLVGCTTDGEISDVFPCTEDSLGLLLIHSDKICFSTGLGENLSQDPEGAVRQAMIQAEERAAGRPKLGLVLAEGLKTFGISLDRALRHILGDHIPIFGGHAGDHYQFIKTFQFHGRQVVSDALILVLFSGPVRFSMNLKSGWKPLGRTFSVNRSKDNVVWEIDNMPAAVFFRKYLGRNHAEFPQFPLAVQIGDDDFVLRDPAFVNEQDNSVVFVGTFPENPQVRLTEFGREEIILAAAQAATAAWEQYPGTSPDLALLCPCTSRRRILGTRAAEEHGLLLQRKACHPTMRLFGMYAYGEIGPLGGSTHTHFHNDTYAVLLLGEEP